MDLFNGILSKLMMVIVIFGVAAAIDVPNNPARTLLRWCCHSVDRFSENMPLYSR